jgi:hypothetical protein
MPTAQPWIIDGAPGTSAPTAATRGRTRRISVAKRKNRAGTDACAVDLDGLPILPRRRPGRTPVSKLEQASCSTLPDVHAYSSFHR